MAQSSLIHNEFLSNPRRVARISNQMRDPKTPNLFTFSSEHALAQASLFSRFEVLVRRKIDAVHLFLTKNKWIASISLNQEIRFGFEFAWWVLLYVRFISWSSSFLFRLPWLILSSVNRLRFSFPSFRLFWVWYLILVVFNFLFNS